MEGGERFARIKALSDFLSLSLVVFLLIGISRSGLTKFERESIPLCIFCTHFSSEMQPTRQTRDLSLFTLKAGKEYTCLHLYYRKRGLST
mmetsp:Transcript_17245/g.34995  ORF Transcript_17245/g.34995 Transcript_17245/m.34995 type:complete len:90 (+) Transcript_17245:228-497(+)